MGKSHHIVDAGRQQTNSTPMRNTGSCGIQGNNAATSKCTATKWATSSAPRKRRFVHARRDSISGTCRNVTDSMNPSNGSMAGAIAVEAGRSQARMPASTTAANRSRPSGLREWRVEKRMSCVACGGNAYEACLGPQPQSQAEEAASSRIGARRTQSLEPAARPTRSNAAGANGSHYVKTAPD